MRVRLASLRSRILFFGGIGLVVLFVLLAAGYVFVRPRLFAAPAQPIAFNHQVMVQTGVTCLYCHTDAMRSASPGIPSVAKCMGCHKTIANTAPVIQQVAAYWDRQEPIPWVRVSQLPRFVYFSHQVHVNAGLNCERCHGDVGHMAVAQPVVTMDMGWCLSCHEQQANVEQLKDCVVCHQ